MGTTVSICGMHRSGTSMVTRLLYHCGIMLGPDTDILPPHVEDNPEGYWENRRFVQLNEELLTSRGSRWDQPPAIEEGWSQRAELMPLYLRAKALIEDFDGHEFWGWKDPRTCLTFEFWHSILPSLKAVICLRHPIETASSLQRRGMSHEAGLALCMQYYDHINVIAKNHEIIVTHYESYFYDPGAELDRVLSFLGLSPTTQDVEQAVKTVSYGLHRERMPDHLARRYLPDPIAQQYDLYCEKAGAVYQKILHDVAYQYHSLRQYTENLQIQFDEVGIKLADTTTFSPPASQMERIAQQQAVIARLNSELARQNAHLTTLEHDRSQFADLQAQLLSIHSTKGWRFLQWWWKLKANLPIDRIAKMRIYELLRASWVILRNEGLFSFIRQLMRWTRGERRYRGRLLSTRDASEIIRIEWDAPASSITESIAGVFPIRGSAQATSGVASLELQVNHNTVAAETISWQEGEKVAFELWWDASRLEPGPYEVGVLVTSHQGNQNKLVQTLWVEQHDTSMAHPSESMP